MMTTNIKHLYIHVPFCKTICSYCDFCHFVYNKDLVNKWLKRFKEEVLECKNESYTTIYIGGGTPTSLSNEELKDILELIKPHTSDTIEYTIEANPESISLEKIKLFKEYGINRVSMGLQSSNDRLLKLMNRHHTFNDVKNAVNLLKDNGIYNISLDIIYSLPFQTLDDLKETLKDALSLNVPHLSLYSLTIEDNTIFKRKGYEPLDEELEADMYEYIIDSLTNSGYEHYEIANFAKKGYESKHNMSYWRYEDFRGLSCGSSSKIANLRYDKTRDINKYINDSNIIEITYELDTKDLMFEHLMMSLRTSEGLDLNEFYYRYNVDALKYFRKSIEKNKESLLIDGNHLAVKNRSILNSILVDFLD